MAKEIIFLVEEDSQGGYIAKALGHSICTQAENIDELKKMTREAVLCHFSESEMPSIIRLHIVKDEVIPV